jgi:ribonuclease HI
MINIYTDGAYSPSRDRGGWAFYSPELHIRVTGNKDHTTVNRMELTAAIKALEFISDANIEDEIWLYSDSMYLVGGMTLGWSTAINTDLWEQLADLKASLLDRVHFVHIRGHVGNAGNEIVDQLAVISSQSKIYDRFNSNSGNQ